MSRKPNAHAGVFKANLQLLLRGRNLTQAQLAKDIGAPKTTVNKWATSNTAPPMAVINRIATTYNMPPEIFLSDPDEFGAYLNISQPEIDEAIHLPSIFLRNVRVPRHDPLMARVVGVYDLYMPSVLYKKKILQRTMKIFEDTNQRYYYEAFNMSEQMGNIVATEMSFSGSIVVSGDHSSGNMILIGGQTKTTIGVQFVGFQLPKQTRFKALRGFLLGEVEGLPFTNPVCAKPIAEAEPNSDIRNYARRSVYVDDDVFFRSNPDVLRVFKELVENSWFPERVRELSSAPSAAA